MKCLHRDGGHGGNGFDTLEWDFGFGDTLEGTWENLRDTIYTLATVLGELGIAKYRLHGVWRGKGSADWEKERIRLDNFEYGGIFRVLE